VHHEGCEARLADDPLVDRSGRHGLARGPAELGADQVLYAGLLRSIGHLVRFLSIAGQGLLAHDVLASSNGLRDDLEVGVGRSRDRDHRHARERQCIVE
jgi:hypothetical protein